jgi:predicted O-methyltransferase YrrM
MRVAERAIPTVEDYARAFEAERHVAYPTIDALEERYGYRLIPGRLYPAARVLACPVKAHAPNWQHGRVLYAVARAYLETQPDPVTMLDIGTAKGFSALCLRWALDDAENDGRVISVDVLDPANRTRRNTVAEVDGYKTLAEILTPWPEARTIGFQRATGIEWLERFPARVHVAFVDGKHTTEAVLKEGRLLANRQLPGDMVVFDDVQIDGVWRAVQQLKAYYTVEIITVNADRRHAIAERRRG